MDMKSDTLDYWWIFFGAAKSDIFDVIEFVITVAASDYPKEFRMRRDRIAEKLYPFQIRVLAAITSSQQFQNFEGAVFGGKTSEVNSRPTEGSDIAFDHQLINSICEEIEDMGQIVGEVLRIKEILSNNQDEVDLQFPFAHLYIFVSISYVGSSDDVLFGSFRRLQLMTLFVEILKETEIGKAVNNFCKCRSKRIRQLARVLIEYVFFCIAGNSLKSLPLACIFISIFFCRLIPSLSNWIPSFSFVG
ncbi:putative mediator of RNA polymerase II transcription subunit 26b [Tasmannia lanceolata]|uniref:putative mediator of RNA polymerase II transcription subunit 26b n=1 Tax=Tasmannia lanceolata TaxID=3420 RepID=UPI004064B40D